MRTTAPPYRGGVLRAVLRPAPLALLALALAIATACALLGQWQVERSRASAVRPALETVVPLTDVLEPATTFTGDVDGQLVRAEGTFTGGEQVLVDGRLQDGTPGRWVVAPLAVAGGGEPALLPVVRGWVPEGTDLAAAAALVPPTGAVAVTGRLIAGEPPQGVPPAGGAIPVLAALSPTDLVNVWDARLYTGFVIAEEPAAQAPLQPVVSSAPTTGTDWRNISYALQWWLFAAFAVVIWWRTVRDRYLVEGPVEPLTGGPPAPSWEDGADRTARPEHHHQEVR